MREQVRAGIVRMAWDSKAARGSGIPPRRYLQQVVFDIWVRLFFALEPGSEKAKQLQTLFRVIDIRNPSNASDAAIRHALDEILQIATRSAGRSPRSAICRPRAFLRPCAQTAHSQLMIVRLQGTSCTLCTRPGPTSRVLWVWLMRLLTENPRWIGELRLVAADELRETEPLSLSTHRDGDATAGAERVSL